MPKYLCQMIGHDGEDEWNEVDVSAYGDSKDAARAYAGICKSRSGGEMLNKPEEDRERVRVRLASNNEPDSFLTYDITMDWVERYYVRDVPVADLQQE